MKRSDILPGMCVTVNAQGDLFMEAEARRFIGKRCVVKHITRGGMVLVRLETETSFYPIPPRNIDPLEGST